MRETSVMTGITRYATYIPRYRLDRDQIATAVGEKARGCRTVAGYDEDTTSMAVEAGLSALGATSSAVHSVWLATTAPAYVDKTNATAVHAALDLPEAVAAFDLGASFRSGAAALMAASRDHGLALMSDVRGGYTGGAEERSGGDAAAAFTFGEADVLAELVASTSVSGEFLDRWRAPGEVGANTWEERFGEKEYLRLGEHVVTDLLKKSGCAAGDVAAVAVAGPNTRAVKAATRQLQARTGGRAESGDLLDLVGNAGAAHLGLVLADTLDHARPGDTLLVLSLADGADAFLLRATDLLPARARPKVRDPLGGGLPIPYSTYLLWRGRVEREKPRRPEPIRPSAPFSARNSAYKFAFRGGRCRGCGTAQFPLPRVCLRCRAVDLFDPVSAAGQGARVVSYTVDRLAFTPSPPLLSAVLDLDVGGRVQCELTDVTPDEIAVGDRVVLTFRRLLTVEGIHNYFWKARPSIDSAVRKA